MKFEEYNPFIDYDEIDSGFIVELNLDIKTKIFPKNRQTFGDLYRAEKPYHINCFPENKVFKNLDLINVLYQKEDANIELDKFGLNETTILKTENIVNNNNFNKNIESHDIKNEIVNETTVSVTENISKIINNKIDQSNQYTQSQIQNLEQNIENITNSESYITNTMLKNIETKIINSDNKIKKELKDEIDKHKKNFKEFIES